MVGMSRLFFTLIKCSTGERPFLMQPAARNSSTVMASLRKTVTSWWSGRLSWTCLSDSMFIPEPWSDLLPEAELVLASMGALLLVAPRPANRLLSRLGLRAQI